jgi:hypothetical protein
MTAVRVFVCATVELDIGLWTAKHNGGATFAPSPFSGPSLCAEMRIMIGFPRKKHIFSAVIRLLKQTGSRFLGSALPHSQISWKHYYQCRFPGTITLCWGQIGPFHCQIDPTKRSASVGLWGGRAIRSASMSAECFPIGGKTATRSRRHEE